MEIAPRCLLFLRKGGIITPSDSVEASALNIEQNIYYWNQSNFVQWAHQAIQVIRTLRLLLMHN